MPEPSLNVLYPEVLDVRQVSDPSLFGASREITVRKWIGRISPEFARRESIRSVGLARSGSQRLAAARKARARRDQVQVDRVSVDALKEAARGLAPLLRPCRIQAKGGGTGALESRLASVAGGQLLSVKIEVVDDYYYVRMRRT